MYYNNHDCFATQHFVYSVLNGKADRYHRAYFDVINFISFFFFVFYI